MPMRMPISRPQIYGNTAQNPPDGFVLNLWRPKEVPLGYIFSVILHRNPLTYEVSPSGGGVSNADRGADRQTSMPAEFLYNLTKNLSAHLQHKFCAVLP